MPLTPSLQAELEQSHLMILSPHHVAWAGWALNRTNDVLARCFKTAIAESAEYLKNSAAGQGLALQLKVRCLHLPGEGGDIELQCNILEENVFPYRLLHWEQLFPHTF